MVLTPIGGVIYRLLASCLIKTECHDITEIFLKVAFNTINQPPKKITQKKKIVLKIHKKNAQKIHMKNKLCDKVCQ
jgi:hypothetical protein